MTFVLSAPWQFVSCLVTQRAISFLVAETILSSVPGADCHGICDIRGVLVVEPYFSQRGSFIFPIVAANMLGHWCFVRAISTPMPQVWQFKLNAVYSFMYNG